MIKNNLQHALIILTLTLSFNSVGSDKAHWSYESGKNGPENWGHLEDNFITCSTGKSQSPVNLTNMIEGDLPGIEFAYQAGGELILNNGHTIQVNYKPGSTISVSGHTFELKQFHFHSPSENTILNRSFPMEAHFVHADKAGNLAVVAVMFIEGAKNPELEKAWNRMPEKADDRQSLFINVDARQLLPVIRDYYRFNGSLTTPPCTEGVWWLVMKNHVTASKEQIEKFTHTLHHPNNRPVQPINARMIVQ
ncbi:MAG: carbonic anhydrase [Gammaproteobacteria bacterium]|nr:carbonic anhydrase [Gammaproteobacteria bacterium]